MLEWTGERFLPWIKESAIAYEHLHRYAYASTLAKDKRVLDLASGEGYGSNMLAMYAESVVGIDIDESVVLHATQKYAGKNLRFLSGSITAVPIADDHSFDMIVCFEAIEHIEDQEQLLCEVKRLLKPGSLFMVSTPNKVAYHDESEEDNPYHVKELYFEEFQQLLTRHFANIRFLGQRIHPSSSIWPIGLANNNAFQEFVVDRSDSGFEFISSGKRVPVYFIAIASDSTAAVLPTASVLLDQSDALIKEKDQELRETKSSAARAINWREQQIREREETIASIDEALRWRKGQIDDLEGVILQLKTALEWRLTQIADLEKTIASNNQALAWRLQQVSELETARDFWERESASRNTSLQNAQRQLSTAAEQLEGIYASRGWKFILGLRKIRDKLMGRAKSRA
jgi:SAM-dependent methyltransferase